MTPRKSSGSKKTAAGSNRKSALPKKTNARRNTKAGREAMSSKSFAVPKGKGKNPGTDNYRIDDPPHARNALARVAQHGTPAEKAMVRNKVAKKYPGITVSAKKKGK